MLTVINSLHLFIICIFFFFLVNIDLLAYLLISEILWIFLFSVVILSGILFNSFLMLAISLIILVAAALEFAVGLLLYYYI